MRRRLSWLVSFCLALTAGAFWLAVPPAEATVVGGPIILMGIDAEDGGPGGHGPIGVYQSVANSLLSNASKGTGILVLGGGKSATDNVTAFWNAIAPATGTTVTYVNGSAVGTVAFTTYELVVVVSDASNTPSGGLTAAENTALSTRDQDFADHVNAGGGLLGFSQTGLAAPWYGYLDAIGAFTVTAGGGSDITPTTAGSAIGITDALDVCCWHDDYVSFPSFLEPLALYAGTTDIGAIGGQRVIVLRNCTTAEATAGVTRPAAGTLYLSDVPSGPSGSTLAAAFGGSLTVRAATTGTIGSVTFELDNAVVGSDSVAPFELAVPVPGPGIHTLRVSAIHATLPCLTRAVAQFLVPDPAVAARGLSLSVTQDVPAEPVVTAGGVSVSGKGGTPSPVSIVDRSQPPAVDRVTVMTDTAEGSALASPISSKASSKVKGVSLLSGVVTADLLESRVSARYDAATGGLTLSDAGTRIAGLKVNGVPVDVSSPNLRVTIPDVGVLVVQETASRSMGTRGEITVNALHLFITADYPANEIVIGSAYAGVNFLGNAFDGPASDLVRAPDDLHSGTDAGDTRATAMPITPGLYSGGVTRGDPTDFYTFGTRQGERVVAVVKPAERTRLAITPGPGTPTVTPETPNVELVLTDPDGIVRSRSTLAVGASSPQKVEINADKPYTLPVTSKGPWVLEVKRRGGSPDGFYTIELQLLPVLLLDQADARAPGDAGDTCESARPITFLTDAVESRTLATTGVIRDADQGDFFSLPVTAGRSLTVTLKPDELADGADFDLYLYRPATAGGAADCTVAVSKTLSGGGDGTKGHPEVVAVLPAVVSGTYVIEVRRVNAVANYYLGIASLNSQPTAAAPDAGAGTDAGNSCALARPLTTGAYQGALVDLPTQDVEDWYSVTLAAGEDLLAVMKPNDPSNFTLELYGPACTRLPNGQLATGSQSGSAPESANVANAAAGTYRVRVLRDPSVAAGNYALGVVVTP